ncbi:hypothetical protein INT44_001613 [Umbelopsis vinacea]|uniref:Response regulatory domain-containing protein n=1 Tax=Umbelopsis vinacea TaxID=44442 RepID=A0A8H7UAK5_9FUNG|nr:hypothetical protein INT44_001613 [Umbelopsis vinacea]
MNDEAIQTDSPEMLTPDLKEYGEEQPLLKALERAADEITSFQMHRTLSERGRISLDEPNPNALLPHVATLSTLLRKLDTFQGDQTADHSNLDDFPDLINLSSLESNKKPVMDLSALDKTISRAAILTCVLSLGVSLHSTLATFTGQLNLVSATYTAGWVAVTSFWARSTLSLVRKTSKKNKRLIEAAKRSSIIASVAIGTQYALSSFYPNVVPPVKPSHTVAQVLCSCLWFFIAQVDDDKKKAMGSVEQNTRDQRSTIKSSLQDYDDKRSTFLTTLATEVEDATVMLTATLHYFSPSRILEGSHELLSACSIPVPIASISAINTTTKQVRYLSAQLPLLARLSLAQTDIDMDIELSTVEKEFDIGDLLQAVGDTMAGIAAKLDVKLVIYHSDNALHYTNVRGDEDVLRHTLINLVRNLLDSCSSGSCIELGLNVTALTGDSEASAPSKLLITFAMTLEMSLSSDNSILPNANLTSMLLAHLGGSLALEDVDDHSTSFIIRLEMKEGQQMERVHESTERPHERLHRQLSNIRFSDEPTLEDLNVFVNRLSGVKVVLYATDQSIFAKHLTSCLASWNVNISHVSVFKPIDDENYFRASDSEVTTPGSESSAAHSSIPHVTGTPEVTTAQGEHNLKTAPPTFILIDDDVHTLEQQLHEFRANAALAQAAQAARRHKRGKSNAYLSQTTAIVHFTSLSEYKKVRDTINWFNAVSVLHPHSVPQIIVVPKPAGPRRFLTALHTAWSNAVVEPQYLPIATSPSSPMTPSSQKSIWNGGLIPNLPSPSHGLDESGMVNESGVHLQRRPGSGIYSPPIAQTEEVNYFTATGSGGKVGSPSGPHAHEVQGSPTGVTTAEGVLFDPSNKSSGSSASNASSSRSNITRSFRSSSTSVGHNTRRRSNTDLRSATDALTPTSHINLPVGFHQPPLDQVSPGGSPLKISMTAVSDSPAGTPSPHPSLPMSTHPIDTLIPPEEILAIVSPSRSPLDIPPSELAIVDTPDISPIANISPAAKPVEKSLAISRRKRKERVAPSGVASPPISVLIVEDNVINQAILSTWMKKHKIKFGTASNGQEALDKWNGGGYHLILMDIQLPVMDGIEATQRIRAIEKEQKTGKIPRQTMTEEPSVFRSPVIIVALTASSLASDREAALSAGCNDFLTKPVDLVWLEKKIIEWGCMQALIDFDSWRKWKRSEGVEPKSTAKPVMPASVLPPPKADGSATVALSPSRSSDSSTRKGVLLPGASGIKRRPSSAAEDTTKIGRRPLSRHNSEPHMQLHEANIKPSISHDTRAGTLSPIKEASGSSDGSVKAMSELAVAEMLQQQLN